MRPKPKPKPNAVTVAVVVAVAKPGPLPRPGQQPMQLSVCIVSPWADLDPDPVPKPYRVQLRTGAAASPGAGLIGCCVWRISHDKWCSRLNVKRGSWAGPGDGHSVGRGRAKNLHSARARLHRKTWGYNPKPNMPRPRRHRKQTNWRIATASINKQCEQSKRDAKMQPRCGRRVWDRNEYMYMNNVWIRWM